MIGQSTRIYTGLVAAILLFSMISTMPHFASAATSGSAGSSTGIIISLYISPGSNTCGQFGGPGTTNCYDALIAVHNLHPNVPIIAKVNPSNGPGTAPDATHLNGFNKLKAAGITVLGYVSTGYARDPNKSIAISEGKIDAYKNWYNLDGIFFDEMSNNAADAPYYSTVSNYAKNVDGMKMTVCNPGTSIPQSDVGVCDTFEIYESAGLASISTLQSRTFYPNYDKHSFYMLAHTTNSITQTDVTDRIPYVGYMYITNDVEPNPYDTIPPYFLNEVAYLDTGSPTTTPPPSTSPGSPTGLTATTISSSQIDLSWTAPSGTISGYMIERAVGSGAFSTIVSNTATTSTTYSDTGTAYATQYTYRVSAINSVGTSTPSNTASATTLTSTLPPTTPPTTLSLAVNSVDLSGSSFTGQRVQLNDSSGNTIATGFTPATFSVTSGSQYTVFAANFQNVVFNHWSDGNTNPSRAITPTQSTTLTAYYSTSSTTTPPPLPTPPGSPTGLTATTVSSSQINLSWTAPTNNGGSTITGYKIERSTDGGTTWNIILASTSHSWYSDYFLSASTTYTYRVSAINAIGTSSSSSTASATTSPATVPDQPRYLNATIASPSQINLSWWKPVNSGGSAITGYKIERSTDGGTTWNTIVANTGIAQYINYYSNTGLLSSTTYTYRISTINAIGTSLPSSTASATTSPATTLPSISLNPTTGPAGSTIAVSGNSFLSNSAVTVSYDTAAVTTNPGAITTDSSGSFTATFTEPAPSTGSHTVIAKDAASGLASAQFTVTSTTPPTTPPTTISLAVNSVDLSGNSFTGQWVQLNDSSGNTIATGFTPATFSVTSDSQYTVFAANFQNTVFNHWSDGNTNPSRAITPTQSTTLTAYYSTSSTTTPPPLPTPPGSPTGLTATTVSSSQINLSWTAPSGTISGYKIERSTSGGTFSTIVSNTATTATTYSDTGLASASQYTYRVSAINSVGTSSPSNTGSATTLTPIPPSILINPTTGPAGSTIAVSGNTFLSNSAVTISYDGAAVTTNPGTITTDSSGSFTATFTEPAPSTGSHTVIAKDAASGLASAQFTVTSTTTTISLTVNSVDLSGNSFTGQWVTLRNSSGNIIATGFTPATFSVTSGSQYTVFAANFQNIVFNHWSDGNTNPSRTITPTQSTTLTAYYTIGTTTVSVTVKSADLSGNLIKGMWVTLRDSSGNTIATGYTPKTFTVTSGAQYTIHAANFKHFVFNHWDDGSTNSWRTISTTQSTTLVSYYSK